MATPSSSAALMLLIVETPTIAKIAQAVPGARQVFALDGDASAVDMLVAAGERVSDTDLEARTVGRSSDSLASIVYTSGTAGNPKGVQLTHRNLGEHALNAAAYPDLQELTSPGKRILPFSALGTRPKREPAVGSSNGC